LDGEIARVPGGAVGYRARPFLESAYLVTFEARPAGGRIEFKNAAAAGTLEYA